MSTGPKATPSTPMHIGGMSGLTDLLSSTRLRKVTEEDLKKVTDTSSVRNSYIYIYNYLPHSIHSAARR